MDGIFARVFLIPIPTLSYCQYSRTKELTGQLLISCPLIKKQIPHINTYMAHSLLLIYSMRGLLANQFSGFSSYFSLYTCMFILNGGPRIIF